MTIEQLGSLGKLVGAIATVAKLRAPSRRSSPISVTFSSIGWSRSQDSDSGSTTGERVTRRASNVGSTRLFGAGRQPEGLMDRSMARMSEELLETSFGDPPSERIGCEGVLRPFLQADIDVDLSAGPLLPT